MRKRERFFRLFEIVRMNAPRRKYEGTNVPVSAKYAKTLLPKRAADSNKATFGSVLNVAGSVNYRGAACLSSLSALRTGAGYVTLACPEKVADSVVSRIPDIVTIPLLVRDGAIERNESKKLVAIIAKYKVVSIGCGLFSLFADNADTKLFFIDFIKALSAVSVPVIIDADGLNIISSVESFKLPERTILTPHPKELSRLLRIDTEVIQADRVAYAKAAAKKFSAVIVLKGHRTVVSDGDSVFINTTGNSSLAKAGSGDVLTGVIAGLCAQGLSPLDAACLGVYLHGKAGELAGKDYTEYGVLSSDLPDYIPRAIKTLI